MRLIKLFVIVLVVLNYNTLGAQVYTDTPTGNVGISTTNPRAVFDVGRLIAGGTLGSVLAR
ncbi:hypothetical protein ACI6Q2_23335, partial [Chitinophagaceae bacterium LWZ2-11]